MVLRVLLVVCLTATTAAAQTPPCCGETEDHLDRVETSLRNADAVLRTEVGTVRTRAQDSALEAQEASTQARVVAGRLTLFEAATEERLEPLEKTTTDIRTHVDRFWLLLAAALVFFMQAGFKCLEAGFVRPEHVATTAMKNLLDWLLLSACFLLVGFAFMWGPSYAGVIGWSPDLVVPTKQSLEEINPKFGLEFFLFQLAFAGTSATIVSGAMAERTGVLPYALVAIFAGAIVYPIVGHWIWGANTLPMDTSKWAATGWLKRNGFLDFAGSTAVHSVGAWISFAGIRAVGPREFRFRGGKVDDKYYASANLGYAVLGVFILWLGWWGFNGGSTLVYDLEVSEIVLNTNVAAAFGGLTALVLAYLFTRPVSYQMLIGGTLGGLVAITAGCNVVTSRQGILIGIGAGVFHNLADWALKKMRTDDPVGAIPVHGACGVWGTLCVGLFGDLKEIAAIRHVASVSRLEQIGAQLTGIAVVFTVVMTASYGFFWLLNATVGLRVSPEEERNGFVIGRTGSP